MNLKLIAAAIAVMGLAACSPDITPQSSAGPASGAAQPAATAETDKPAQAPVAQEEKKDEVAAPVTEAKKEDGEKKAD